MHLRTDSRLRIPSWRAVLCVCIVLSATGAIAPKVQASLVPAGSVWKYLDDGSDQGSAWRDPLFDDSGWSSGPAELGYGDGDEATVVGFGPDPANKFVTTYFRLSFDVPDATAIGDLTLRLLRDDGAVVYLNGTEVFRSNMPADPIDASTLASSGVGGAGETVFHTSPVDPALLVDGTNVLAVEVHQFDSASSDISFDLELVGTSISRGPYLQLGTPTSVTVRFRTCVATESRVRYGLAPDNLTQTVEDAALSTEHELVLSPLVPDTRYYYSVGNFAGTLAGGDDDHSFVTSPLPGTPKPTRIWVIGDSGTANADARAVRDAYLSFTGARGTDLWLMLGDNAYLSGTDEQYQAAVFDTYPTVLRSTVVWPTLGNHDAEGNGVSMSTGTGPYFDMFTLPDAAQAGGLVSGTEAYYSFDYANIHFINVNSTGSDRSVGSPMLTWLENDLAATSQDWVIAYWHHPPYTKGSHNSDNLLDSDGRLFEMRENVLPILEAHGVDLVLTGHSHSYERSYLLDGHYGTSGTLAPGMILDSGNGRLYSDGAYAKATLGPAGHEGAVYSVVGSSGLIGGGPLDHPAMVVSFNVLGSMVLDVSGNRLDATVVSSTGALLDSFGLLKGPRADALPDIRANGQDGILTIAQGAELSVTIALDPADYVGDPGDWWIVPLFYDSGSGSWVPFGITDFQAPFFDLSPVELFNTTALPAGFFMFYFGVDTVPDGTFDPGQVFADAVVVEVQ